MPAQVATDYLCFMERLTSSMRKTFLDARCTIWCASEEKKPREWKLSRRYGEATLLQLGKWNRRARKKRRGLQNKYAVAIGLPSGTVRQQLLRDRLVAGLDLAAAMVDQVIDGTQTDLEWRACVAKGVAYTKLENHPDLIQGNQLRTWNGKTMAWDEERAMWRRVRK